MKGKNNPSISPINNLSCQTTTVRVVSQETVVSPPFILQLDSIDT